MTSPSAGAPALKYGYVNTETASPGEAKGLIRDKNIFYCIFLFSFSISESKLFISFLFFSFASNISFNSLEFEHASKYYILYFRTTSSQEINFIS